MNMTRMQQICSRLLKLKKTDYIVILLVGVLLLIVVLPVKENKNTGNDSQDKAKGKSVSESTYDDEEYEKLLEKKLENIPSTNHTGAPPIIPPLLKYISGNTTYIAATPMTIAARSVLLRLEDKIFEALTFFSTEGTSAFTSAFTSSVT